MSDFTSHPASRFSNPQSPVSDLQSQLQELEYTIASLGTDEACRQALLQLERFEARLMTYLETAFGEDRRWAQQDRLLTQILQIGSALYRHLELDTLLQEIVRAVHDSLGFGAVVLNLVDRESGQVRVAAHIGLDEEGRQRLENATYDWQEFAPLLQERFRVGGCYFIPHGELDWRRDFHGPMHILAEEEEGEEETDGWHPEDVLLVPIEPRPGQVMGVISVDRPADGRRPSPETLQALEIFARQAASAIENAQLYQQAQQELSRRQQVEEELLKFRLGIERSDAAIFLTDINGTIIYVNPAFEKIYGYTREEALGKTPRILKSGVLSQEVYKQFWDTLLSKQVVSGELINKTKDGRLITIEGSANPILDDAGNIIGFLAIQRDVTARKQREETLKRLSSVVEQMTEAVTITNRDGVIEYVNPAFEKVTGYSKEEAIGQTPRLLKSGQHDQAFYQKLWDTILAGQVFRGEMVNRKKNGELFYEEKIITPIRDEQGNITYFVATGRDITARKQAEEALRKSEERFALAVRGTNDGLWDWDIQNNTLYWSPRLKELLGYAEDELEVSFEVFDSMLHPDDKERVAAAIDAHLKERVPYDVEERLRTKSGEYRWFRARGQAIWDENGEPIRMVGATTDITEQKQAEEALRKSEERFALAVQGANDGIWDWDIQNNTLYWSPRLKALLGYADDELEVDFNTFDSFLHPDDKEQVAAAIEAHLKERVPYNVEQRLRTKSGEYRWFNARGQAIWDENGEPIRMVGATTDITERKQAEAERERLLQALARRSNQLQTAAEVSRAVTSILDPDELMQQVVNLAQERFGLYYVGLFLVDQTGEWTGEANRWAVLRAGTGEAGRKMLEAGHKLEIGGESMVGWCVAHRQARIALDVGEEAVRFANPLLPETRSEMALPLISRGEVIGAMTVQSTEEAAFSDEDIAVLQTMADQVAVAIENARLLTETQKALQEVQAVHQSYLRQGWEEFLASREQEEGMGYLLTREGLKPASQFWTPEIEQAIQDCRPVVLTDADGDRRTKGDGRSGDGRESTESRPCSALAAPLTLRGQVIGALDLFDPERPHEWTEDDLALVEAVADQVALAVENARLFERTQAALAETEALYRASRRILASTDLPQLYRVVVDELAARLGADQCRLVIFDPRQGCGRIEAEYRPTPGIEDVRIPMAGNPSYEILRDTLQPIAIEDVSTHPVTAQMKEMFAEQGIKSVLLVPIVVRGELIGSVGIDSVGKPRTFSQAEIDFCQTLVGQAAIAVQNLRQLQEIEARARREAIIREISAKVSSSMDLKTVLQTTVRELSQVLGASQAIVHMKVQPDESAPDSETNGHSPTKAAE